MISKALHQSVALVILSVSEDSVDLRAANDMVEMFVALKTMVRDGLGFPVKMPGNTSKKLDKYVVVRVILHGQCSLQRKEAR